MSIETLLVEKQRLETSLSDLHRALATELNDINIWLGEITGFYLNTETLKLLNDGNLIVTLYTGSELVFNRKCSRADLEAKFTDGWEQYGRGLTLR